MKVTESTLKAGFPELRGTLESIKFPAFVEIKYDGEFNKIIHLCNETYCLNKYGKQRTDFPALNNVRQELINNHIVQATFLCELFYGDGKRGSLYQFLSHKTSDSLNLSIFDITALNGLDLRKKELIERKEILKTYLKNYTTDVLIVDKIDEAEYFTETFINEGYEGTVVKSINGLYYEGPCDWVKVKYKDRSEFQVVAVSDKEERIEIAVCTPDPKREVGTLQPLHRAVVVGVKAPMKYKRYIKIGDEVTVEHQGILESGSLRHPVLIPRKEWK